MPRNGSGTYSLPEAAFVPGTVISSAAVNDDFSDIASALTDSLAADGQTPMTGAIQGAAGSVSQPSYSFVGDLKTGFYHFNTNVIGVAIGGALVGAFNASGAVNTNGIPNVIRPGMVMDYAGATAPSGWLLCFGQSLDTTTYALLFAAIGYTYGGSGTNFNLPDCRGRGSYGKDDMGGSAANRITSTISGINGTTLGANGGAQYILRHGGVDTAGLLDQNMLPNVSPTTTLTYDAAGLNLTNSITPVGTTGTYNSGTGVNPTTTGGAGGFLNTGTGNTFNGTNKTLTAATSSINGNTSQQGVVAMNPAIVFNKIIFAGV